MNPISARFNRSLSIPDPVYWWGIVVVFLLAGVVTIAAPAEQTLGSGIRPVYVHVGLTWTGTAVFLLAAVLGVLVLHPQNPIGTSSSTGIRSTFFVLFALFFVAALMIIRQLWQIRQQRQLFMSFQGNGQ